MRNIEDMLFFYDWDAVTDPAGEADLSELEQKVLLEKTLKKAGLKTDLGRDSQRKKKTKPVLGGWRKWLLAAACVMIAAFGSVSFAHFVLDENLLDLFQARQENQIRTLSQMGCMIDAREERGGVEVHLGQAVCDSNTVYVTMDIIGPEDMILSAPYYSFMQMDIQFPGLGIMSGGYYLNMLPDENPLDNTVSAVLCFNGEKTLNGQEMHLVLKDLKTMKSQEEIEKIKQLPQRNEPGTPGDAYDWEKVVTEGSWEFSFRLNREDPSVILNPKETIQLTGGACTIRKVRISPISVTAEMTGDGAAFYDQDPAAYAGQEPIPEDWVVVTLNDGSQVSFSGGSWGVRGKKLTVTGNFDRIVEMAQIRSVTVAGTELMLEQQ